MRCVICMLCFCTVAFAGPSRYGQDFQKVLHTMQEVGEELQQETSLDKLSGLMDDWTAFKNEYKKSYKNEEQEKHRLRIFAENRRKIAAHNEKYKKGLSTHLMDINEFADKSQDEFIKTMTGDITSDDEDDFEADFTWNNIRPSIEKDWRDAVTPVKHQGDCLACRAFVAEIGEKLQQETSLDELFALIDDWTSFKNEYKKSYENEEQEKHRLRIFAENRRKIAAHNEKYKKGLSTHFLDINEFADKTEDEFIKTMTGDTAGDDEDDIEVDFTWKNIRLPIEMDWRHAVTPVKHQGDCLACWAFAATGALESRYFIKEKNNTNGENNLKPVSLSEQNLIDCSSDTCYKNNGCAGGKARQAFSYIQDNGGIDTEIAYPYEAKLGYCRYMPDARGAWDGGYTRLTKSENNLKFAVATGGPVAVSIDPRPLQLYKGGIIRNEPCSNDSKDLNHAVLVTGYGYEKVHNKKIPYWMIKNSWGVKWGLNGYFKLVRNKKNYCGIANRAVYPIV